MPCYPVPSYTYSEPLVSVCSQLNLSSCRVNNASSLNATAVLLPSAGTRPTNCERWKCWGETLLMCLSNIGLVSNSQPLVLCKEEQLQFLSVSFSLQVPAPTVLSLSDDGPWFELKGMNFPLSLPLTSDSAYQDVYTSDKLNFKWKPSFLQ